MNAKNFVTAGIVGGITFFFLGWLTYGILFIDLMKSNAGTATGVQRLETEMVWWALILGNLFSGFLISYVFTKVGNINTPAAGAKTGAMLGFLMAASVDLTMYGTTNLFNVNGVFIDIIVFTLMTAIAGAVIAWVLGKAKS